MQNHVENIITLQGDKRKIREMLEAVQNDDLGIGTIDFNKITGMPNRLNIEVGSRTKRGLEFYKSFIEVYTLLGTINTEKLHSIPVTSEERFLRERRDIPRDEWELGKRAWQNIRDFGAPTWYEWCTQNWGTKWNAYGYDEGRDYRSGNKIWFQSAWAAPHPVIEKLAARYTEISFEHQWADEDIGHNCGRRCYSGGERTEEYIPESEKEAIEFACGIWDCDPSDMDLILNANGTGYICVESEEYQAIELFDKPALFANGRLTDQDIPAGLYCYHLRHGDGGEFASLEPKVGVNHGGTVITKEPIDFGEAGYIPLTEDTAPNFTGEFQTFGEFLRTDSPQESEVMKLC